jgi:hypothetical protein
LSFFFQPDYDGEKSELDHSSPPINISNSGIPSGPHSHCHCAEHLSRIVDLEGRLSLLKRQAKTAMDQAGKSFGLMKWVSSLESLLSDLMAKIVHLEECGSFLIEIIESACEQLQCEFLEAPLCFLLRSCGFILMACSKSPLGTPRGRYDEHSSKSSLSCETKVYRTSRRKPNFRR